MGKKHLNEVIQPAQTEEELKFYFTNYFQLPISTKNRVDLYTEQILYEFKLDSNLFNIQIRAKTAAQALYYVRRLKLGDVIILMMLVCMILYSFGDDLFAD